MASLDHIGLKYGTDKSSSFHNYCNTYERYFSPLRYRPVQLLEVGVDKGSSIKMWLEYFPNALVSGVDIMKSLDFTDPRFEFRQGNQEDIQFWRAFNGSGRNWDIIIDDGGHVHQAIITTFEQMFPRLMTDGLYIVEDLHVAYDPEYQRGGGVNVLDYFRNLIDTLNQRGARMCGNPKLDKSGIAFIHFFKSLVIIGRKHCA